MITAVEMARSAGMNPKAFRRLLRKTRLPWHREGDRWEVAEGSDRHQQMLAVLKITCPKEAATHQLSTSAFRSRARMHSDEAYVIDIVDRLLSESALRGHRFVWLLGDGPRPARLPVDAYYPAHCLVVEYHERQHAQPVAFFDKPGRLTVSGVHRGEQRAIYDQRRRAEILERNLHLLEIRYDELAHDARGRLVRRVEQDEVAIRRKMVEACVLINLTIEEPCVLLI